MTSATVKSVQHFFQATVNGSVDDLHEILHKDGLEETIKLSQSYNEIGETPLLVAISKRHFHIVRFMVDKLDIDIAQVGRFVVNGAVYADCPPLFAAIVSDQPSFVRYLINERIRRDKPLLHLDFFLATSMNCRQKINVLEVMGAACLLSGSHGNRRFLLPLLIDGSTYWQNAIALGSSTADFTDSHIPCQSSTPAFQLKDSTLAVITFEEIKMMVAGASEHNVEIVKGQALHVCQRVLSEMQLFPNSLFISHVLDYSHALLPTKAELQRKTKDEVQHLSNSAMYALRWVKVWCEKENAALCMDALCKGLGEEAIFHCWKVFEFLRTSLPGHVVPFNDLMLTLDFACEYLHWMYTKIWPSRKNHGAAHFIRVTRLVRDISAAIFRRLPQLSQEERQQFKRRLSHYVRLYRGTKTDRPKLLHEACCLSYVISQKEANYDKVVQMFLDAGEDPNATDSQGNTPLHYLLPKNDYQYCLIDPWDNPNGTQHTSIASLNYVAVTRLLLNSGCHIDQPNKGGETILGLLKWNRRMQELFDKPFDPYLQSIISTVLPLTCLCAQFIRKHDLCTAQLPLALMVFVQRH